MLLLELAAALLALIVAVFAFFTTATYALASRHQAWRPLSAAFVAAAREYFWSVLVFLLIPAYYLVGRRQGRGSGAVPVVFVHGYTENRSNFLKMARHLSRTVAGPLYGFNYNWLLRVEPCAEALKRFVDGVCAETGAAQVDLVCHSLGGLVARTMVASGGAPRVRCVVTLGSPHAGVTWTVPLLGGCGPQMKRGSEFLTALARPTPVPLLSIFSSHDNIVHPTAASAMQALGGADHLVEAGYGHLSLLFVPEVAELVRRFLESQPAVRALPAAAEAGEGAGEGAGKAAG